VAGRNGRVKRKENSDGRIENERIETFESYPLPAASGRAVERHASEIGRFLEGANLTP